MQLAKREWRGRGRWSVPLKAAGFGIVLGIMGPFGTQAAFSPLARYLFWVGVAVLGFASAAIALRLLRSEPLVGRRALRIAVVAAASAVPMTFFVAWAMGVLQPDRPIGPTRLAILYPFVALVQGLIVPVLLFGEKAPTVPDADPIARPLTYPSDFLGKLPVAMREGIVALEAEDHYLRVHTRSGSTLILMRLADATAAIDTRLGIRVHRSWWVARDAVASLERTGGRTAVRLTGGLLVPVSRSYLCEARELVPRR